MITEPGATSEDDKLRAGAPCIRTQGPTYKPFSYESRSLRSPFFSLALPFLWSERPSLFLPLSPVRAPPASFMRPLALSIFPSFLSSLLLLVGTVALLSSPSFSTRSIGRAKARQRYATRLAGCRDPLCTPPAGKGPCNGLGMCTLPGLPSRRCASRVPDTCFPHPLPDGWCFL